MKNPLPKNPFVYVAAVFALLFLTLQLMQGSSAAPRSVDYTKIVADIGQPAADGKPGETSVKSATLDDTTRTVTLTLKDGSQEAAGYPLFGGPDVLKALTAQKLATKVAPQQTGSLLGGILTSLIPVIVIGALLMFMLRGRGGLNVGRFGKGRGEKADVPTTRFSDVAGADEAVAEMQEVVEFLKNPDKFRRAGAKVPHGFLLEGPPGTGKTLLARAVAGEAEVPFFAVSGSDFVETYVGVGASRARALFDKAKAAGKSIIFIDEVDAIGRARSSGAMHGATQEHENTLIQILSEMDGFDQNEVIVIAATNRADVLDSALTRPGRLDRKINVPSPDRAGRQRILELYARGKAIEESVDFALLARQTPGMSGADLAFLMNEAALEAARRGKISVGPSEVQAALSTAVLGRERRSAVISQRDQRITAWHEAGHTVAALVQEDADDPVSVSVVPRGATGGVTWMGGSDHNYATLRQNRAALVTSMAGRAAEKRLLSGDFSQGAVGDLQSATSLATQMVANYGMGKRMIFLSGEHLSVGNALDEVSEEVSSILEESLAQAERLLEEHAALLERIAEELLVHESLDLAAIKELRQEVEGMPVTPSERVSSEDVSKDDTVVPEDVSVRLGQ